MSLSPGSTQLFNVAREKLTLKSWVEPGDEASYTICPNCFVSECVTVMLDHSVSSSVFPFTASLTTPLVMKDLWLSQKP